MNFYYTDQNKKPVGPLSETELKKLHTSGTIQNHTLVISEGASQWKTYADHFGSEPKLPPVPSSSPPAAPTVSTSVPLPGGEKLGMAKAVGAAAYAKAEEAAVNAWQALKILAVHPTGKLKNAFEGLGEKRALTAGIVFGVAFDFCVIVGAYLLMRHWFGMGRGSDYSEETSVGAKGEFLKRIFKLVVIGATPLLSISVASTLLRKVFSGVGSFAGDVFTAGASLIPLGLFILFSGILGIGNIEVIIILGVFALCYTVLMLYGGCVQISRFSEERAALSVPAMLLVSAWLAKIMVTSLL